jgi:hypothetical protein
MPLLLRGSIVDGGIVTKWAALAIKVLLTDNKSVSKANYSAMVGIRVPEGVPTACTISARPFYKGGIYGVQAARWKRGEGQ